MKALYVKSGSVFAILSLLIAFGGSLPHAAQAGDDPQICGPRDIIIQRLAARFEERQSAVGMTNGGVFCRVVRLPKRDMDLCSYQWKRHHLLIGSG